MRKLNKREREKQKQQQMQTNKFFVSYLCNGTVVSHCLSNGAGQTILLAHCTE